ncbi:MAG: hypothetical protein ACRDZO_00805 [Egibacteraceae bacterium]
MASPTILVRELIVRALDLIDPADEDMEIVRHLLRDAVGVLDTPYAGGTHRPSR